MSANRIQPLVTSTRKALTRRKKEVLPTGSSRKARPRSELRNQNKVRKLLLKLASISNASQNISERPEQDESKNENTTDATSKTESKSLFSFIKKTTREAFEASCKILELNSEIHNLKILAERLSADIPFIEDKPSPIEADIRLIANYLYDVYHCLDSGNYPTLIEEACSRIEEYPYEDLDLSESLITEIADFAEKTRELLKTCNPMQDGNPEQKHSYISLPPTDFYSLIKPALTALEGISLTLEEVSELSHVQYDFEETYDTLVGWVEGLPLSIPDKKLTEHTQRLYENIINLLQSLEPNLQLLGYKKQLDTLKLTLEKAQKLRMTIPAPPTTSIKPIITTTVATTADTKKTMESKRVETSTPAISTKTTSSTATILFNMNNTTVLLIVENLPLTVTMANLATNSAHPISVVPTTIARQPTPAMKASVSDPGSEKRKRLGL